MTPSLELRDLAPEPAEEWRRLLRFVGWSDAERQAAARSVEPLFRRGPELVVGIYDYLASVPETAALLAAGPGPNDRHLDERRRFFTLWLARTLGLDTSDEFATGLFQAGIVHAGHGPRRTHVPSEYVTGSIGLVLAAFARYLAEGGLSAGPLAAAIGAWSKYLTAQLDLLLLGYRAARELESGSFGVRCSLFGRLRPLVGRAELTVGANPDAQASDLLRKLFNYSPRIRAEALDRRWDPADGPTGPGGSAVPIYLPRPGWRVLLNGRDLRYADGFATPVTPGDELAVFPPGR